MEAIRIFADLETSRLILRHMTAEDTEFVFHHFSDADVCRYLYDAEPFRSEDDAISLIRWYDNKERPDHNRWLMVLKDTSALIGTCGYHAWDRDNNIAEIGYDMRREFWGYGYMTEAMQAALQHGFGSMNLNRVQAYVAPENEGSVRLLQRLGFMREGTVREKHLFRERYYDHYCFSLLRREWHPIVDDTAEH
jgi:ribosomal-protein-alanine N-acetyltransferase